MSTKNTVPSASQLPFTLWVRELHPLPMHEVIFLAPILQCLLVFLQPSVTPFPHLVASPAPPSNTCASNDKHDQASRLIVVKANPSPSFNSNLFWCLVDEIPSALPVVWFLLRYLLYSLVVCWSCAPTTLCPCCSDICISPPLGLPIAISTFLQGLRLCCLYFYVNFLQSAHRSSY